MSESRRERSSPTDRRIESMHYDSMLNGVRNKDGPMSFFYWMGLALKHMRELGARATNHDVPKTERKAARKILNAIGEREEHIR